MNKKFDNSSIYDKEIENVKLIITIKKQIFNQNEKLKIVKKMIERNKRFCKNLNSCTYCFIVIVINNHVNKSLK